VDDLSIIFKAYDVRGIFPEQVNEEVAYRIGEAYTAIRKPKRLAVGRDVRASGEKLKAKLIESLLDAGVDVIDIGVITTDQLYFTVGNYGLDGGISVTASHNPGEYNGFKFSEKGGSPISSENLISIRDWAASSEKLPKKQKGELADKRILDDYVDHVISYIHPGKIKPMHLVANANFGGVGQGVDKIAQVLGLTLERMNWQQDGTFPKGPPNPLLPESRAETIKQIKKTKPDLGVAWDADADRVFFYTGEGEFIPSSYIIALLAPEFLKHHPGASIVHDLTLRWVVDDAVKAAGGVPVLNRVGHTFIKGRMRQEHAPFAGESSGHYYFQKSFYSDNGLVPLLMILQIISESGKSLDELIAPLKSRYVMIDEKNFKSKDPAATIAKVEKELGSEGSVDKTDGVTVESRKWRINLRPSNTEPLIRLNAEAHDQDNLSKIVRKVQSLINT
jgi:phosphomannomutase